jgi:hypothetical protein
VATLFVSVLVGNAFAHDSDGKALVEQGGIGVEMSFSVLLKHYDSSPIPPKFFSRRVTP